MKKTIAILSLVFMSQSLFSIEIERWMGREEYTEQSLEIFGMEMDDDIEEFKVFITNRGIWVDMDRFGILLFSYKQEHGTYELHPSNSLLETSIFSSTENHLILDVFLIVENIEGPKKEEVQNLFSDGKIHVVRYTFNKID